MKKSVAIWHYMVGEGMGAFDVFVGKKEDERGISHAFLQVVAPYGQEVFYQIFPIEAFRINEEPFFIRLGSHHFSAHELKVSLKRRDLSFEASFMFSPVILKKEDKQRWGGERQWLMKEEGSARGKILLNGKRIGYPAAPFFLYGRRQKKPRTKVLGLICEGDEAFSLYFEGISSKNTCEGRGLVRMGGLQMEIKNGLTGRAHLIKKNNEIHLLAHNRLLSLEGVVREKEGINIIMPGGREELNFKFSHIEGIELKGENKKTKKKINLKLQGGGFVIEENGLS